MLFLVKMHFLASYTQLVMSWVSENRQYKKKHLNMNTKLGLMGRTDCSFYYGLASHLLFILLGSSCTWYSLFGVVFISPVVTKLCYSRSPHITQMWLMAQCVLMRGVGGLCVCARALVGCVVCLVCACSDASGERRSGFLTHRIDWHWGAPRSEARTRISLCFFPLSPHPHYNTRERGMLYKANFWSVANNLQAERKQ